MALITVSAFAVESLDLGYCDGEMNKKTSDAFALIGTADDVSAAIRIPAEQARIYAGCQIEDLNLALASTLNVESVVLWLRSSLDGENLAQSATYTSAEIKKEWNMLSFSAPYVIPADCGDLYIGLTFHQKGTASPLSVIAPKPNLTNDAFLLKLGSNAEWSDRTEEGVLAFYALVEGQNLPQYNLTLKALTVAPVYTLAKGKLTGTVTVRNNAAATISGFDIVCHVDNDTQNTYTVHKDEALAYGESKVFEFEIGPLAVTGDEPTTHSLTATINNLTEGDDVYMADNSASAPFNVVARSFERNVLLEEFTTEMCVNCPRVAGNVHALLAKEEFAGRINAICHHSAYGTDWLTIDADKTYLWLYGPVGAFAPALLFDRVCSPLTSSQNPKSPVFLPDVDAEKADAQLTNIINARLAEPAFVDINLEVVLTDGNAHVKVTGERATEVFTVNQPRIVVGLIEDNIEAKQQIGAEGKYFQQHVNRCYNSTWGKNLHFDGNSYSYECDLTVKPEYVKENLSVVAYIWDYDAGEVANCEVCNSNAIPYSMMDDRTTGIAEIFASPNEVQYYNLQGNKIDNPAPGTVVIAVGAGKSAKIIMK